MKLIVGLGNPGPKYQMTRHNIGFLFIDALVEVYDGQRRFKNEFKAETQKVQIAGQPVLVCKPQTFMNNSGEAVQPLMGFYGIEPRDLIVVHDEVDVPFGELRFQIKRGHGGHNGIRNIHQLLGTDDYARLRLGVGRPPVFVNDEGVRRAQQEVHEWVLSPFSKAEQARMHEVLELAMDGLEVWLKSGVNQAATEFNSKAIAKGS
jgi:PTH1 family peptidyl-tRNA hydrolase